MHRFKTTHTKNSAKKTGGSIDGFFPQNRVQSSGHTDDFVASANPQSIENMPDKQPEIIIQAIAHHGNLLRRNAIVHKTKPRKNRIKQVFKVTARVFSGAFIVVLLGGGFLFGKAWLSARSIFKGGGDSSILFSRDIRPDQLKGEGDGRINIMLMGVAGGANDGADLTDTILIASIDPVAKDVTLLSVPRDLWVKVTDYWSMKINAVYQSGRNRALENSVSADAADEVGFSILEQTVEKTLSIPIHYRALVNFQAFREGIDAVGGINVNVEKQLYDESMAGENNGSPVLAAVGTQTFNGEHALVYARSRYTTSDFDRSRRQREILIALKDKVLTVGTFSNPKKISSLIDALGNNVSSNATLGEIMRMYEISKDIAPSSISSIDFTTEPNVLVDTTYIGDQSVVVPSLGTFDYDDIHAYMRNALRDPYLKSENATITILNATNKEGLATKKATELKSYGYNVTVVDSALTSDITTTRILAKAGSNIRFTQSYLEKRVGKKVETVDPLASTVSFTTDFVILLGLDEVSKNPY